ncbi:MAG: glycosyltransferase family 9 protein [Deltaproteobacteria bacterium]|nr:glycosyltransferase family 9 protein [Deltaproteobacteria bacterium]
MRFLCVNRPATAEIFGQPYRLRPLNPRIENIEDILVADIFTASELLTRHAEVLLEVDFDTTRFKGFPTFANSVSDISPGDTVLLLRSGGIGDHVMLMPALRIFREKFPAGSKIWLAIEKEKHCLFANHDGIDRLLPLPLRLSTLLGANKVIDFSSRQDWFDLESIHMTDGYLNFLKIDYKAISDKTPNMMWDPNRAPHISGWFERIRKDHPGQPLVLLNWKASNRLRDLPAEKLLFLTDRFEKLLFVVAQPADHSQQVLKTIEKYDGKRVYNLTPAMKSLEDYIAVVHHCDAVVSTDTATGHLAESLQRPSLVLYGPTRDDLWIRYYKKTCPLRAEYIGHTCRSPCGRTKNTGNGCPESLHLETSYSPCLLSITEERIESEFRKMLETIRLTEGPKCFSKFTLP